MEATNGACADTDGRPGRPDGVGAPGGTPFSVELERLRVARGVSWRQLSKLVGYSPSWLSKVKNGVSPSPSLARRCDEVLGAGGGLLALADNGPDRLPPAQLPAATSGFVGRQAELARMDEVLAGLGVPGTPGVVLVEGPPGVGKTALALRWSHDVADRFTGGRLHADLRGYADGPAVEPADVLDDFLVALGVPAHRIPAEPDRKATLYRSVVASRGVLIVLDNAARAEQVEPLLPGAAGCAVVITSRNRMFGLAVRTHAVRISLGALDPAESAALLRTTVGAAAGSERSIDALARLCANVPLALRIAAELVATHAYLSVEEAVALLSEESRRLDMLSQDPSLALRSVLRWSCRDLGADATRMLELLARHPEPEVDVATAATLGHVSAAEARGLLDGLTGENILQRTARDRYAVDDLMRLFALEHARHRT
ncbi:helix-turn-helix domain-containing protein [Saccharothrix sp. NRRL B-16348]|uniref:helix-turn-helix domain-containing protein n=1 Tax=Saccharothrix sp. NRRL B-16348 TaxID=1415542 RepID=UPI0006AFF722|nr:helix-turn-helix domain-containing protein [Saccharothrix sp. NRRL B-16348]